jgi:hypothetical protein
MKRASIIITTTIALIAFIGAAQGQERELLKKTFDVEKNETLVVEATAADVIVTARSGETLTATILGDDDAENYLTVSAEKKPDGVRVTATKKTSAGWGNSLDASILVEAPREYDSRIKTMGGDLAVTGMNGKHELETMGGDVAINDGEGETNARTAGGDVVLHNYDGVANVMTSGGDIAIYNSKGALAAATSGGDVYAKNVKGDLDAKSSGGDLDLSVEGGALKASTSGGDVRVYYEGEVEKIDLSTSAGDIELTLDRDAKATFRCETGAGEIEIEHFGASIDNVERDEASGEINGGGGEVRLRNSAGDILLKSK